MQVIEGYFINQTTFVPSGNVVIPQNMRAIVTILNEPAQPKIAEDSQVWLLAFHRMVVESIDENDVFSDEAFIRRPSGRALVTFSDED